MVICGHMSDWLPVFDGVQQGSVFGSILLIVYIDDLDVNVEIC